MPSTRKTAGIHSRLDHNFEWPPVFGTREENVIASVKKDDLKKMDSRQGVDDGNEIHAIDDRDNSRSDRPSELPKSNSVNDIVPSIRSVCTRNSKAVTESLQRKRHALEVEQIKQAIELKKLENRLKIIELENEVRESEIIEKDILSSRSDRSKISLPEEEINPKDNTLQWVNEICDPTNDKKEQTEDLYDLQPEKPSEIRQLCETISAAIKSVATTSNQDRFVARQVVEKDFNFFDGNPEEWPIFLSQFQRISTLCQYSPEEKMIKLQKCLRGEAKLAVAGMMASPDNIELVLRTLQMRFGRPDQIIDQLITKIRCLPSVKENNIDGLIHFSNHVCSLVATINSLRYDEHLRNPQLMRDLLHKLPDLLKLQWGEEVMDRDGRSNLEDFSKWINRKASAACFVGIARQDRVDSRSRQAIVSSRRHETALVSTYDRKSADVCKYCQTKGHVILNCPKMKADPVDTRWTVVTNLKLCFSCLKGNHQTMRCRTRRQCGIKGCKWFHCKLLHKDIQTSSTDADQSTQTTFQNENIMTIGHGVANVLLRMVKVRLYGQGRSLDTVALCDEGSSVTLIDNLLARKLQLEGRSQPLCLHWTNDLSSLHETSTCLNLKISGIFDGAREFPLKNVRTVENLSLPMQIIKKEDWEQYPHLRGIPFDEIDERPMILLGQDHIKLTVARKVIQHAEDSPLATKTNLGWILHGNSLRKNSQHFSFHICSSEMSDDVLHQLVKQSFTTDAFGVMPVQARFNKEEARAIQIMKETAKRVDGRFEIGLLWKKENLQLPPSKASAIRRLECIERQMQKDDNFRIRYCAKIASYVEKSYARKLSSQEANEFHPRCWYLPHFGVVNSNKPNKFRLVFDAASKSQGMSLNDNLLSGPDLLQSLVDVLLKFRLRKIAFCGDIREMFHQVRIIEEDQHSLRFLWRDGDMSKPYDVYVMQVMTFGATCSPTCAQYIKNLNAEQLTKNEKVLDAITKKHYVDDYLDCTDTVEEALKMIKEVTRIQKLGGFDLVGWISNSKEVRDIVYKDEVTCKDLSLNSDSSIQRVLGLTWNSKDDVFCFKLDKFKDTSDETCRPTKRLILKIVMSVFDPLGFIVNFTIKARILIQDIWRSGIGWDDSIDDELFTTWKLWKNDLQKIEEISIPRCYSLRIPDSDRRELHIFCDASKKAFAAAVYLRVISENKIDVCLVMARARVAPTKPISIPRLELQAAVMGSRLAKSIKSSLSIKIDEIFLWSDSTTVLYWIRSDATRLGSFEAHRIGEIQELTNSENWHWIPSKLNVADCATRTYSKEETMNFEIWLRGPEFLYDINQDSWPKSCIDAERKDSIELDDESVLISTSTDEMSYLPDLHRFSKWLRLIRSTAYVLRFRNIILAKKRKIDVSLQNTLTVQETQEAEFLWIKRSQYESFKNEIDCIKANRPLNSRSRLKNLSPALNECGLLVVSGRTDCAPNMTHFTRRPIILPRRHPFTYLLLHHYHEKFAHQGVETILNEVRQRYWVIDGRSAVKSVFARCQKCKLRRAKPIIPIMGQLPAMRLTPNVRPFTYTGVDYFGPLYVTVGRRREKRWGVLFTCLTIRAVHLEVAHSLTTDSTIMAVQRMISRRGRPKEIHSDNGTNLRGAAEELKKAVKELDRDRMTNAFTDEGITWKFLAPASPHMAGVWERLVRSVKNTFSVILNGQSLKDELLGTLFAECENIINSRPLTKVSVDSNDLESLTPNHLLLGYPNNTMEFGNSVDLRREWQKTQKLADCFWKRWTKEYLPTLTKRSKWTSDGKPLKVNDIVIIVDENTLRRCWKLGKIETVYPGIDGRIRVADVRTATGIYKRPVTKLCRIDIENDEMVRE